MSDTHDLPPLARIGHAQHCKVCLQGLPSSKIEAEPSRLALAFYCLGSLDLLGLLQSKTSELDRQNWQEWIWEQQSHGPHGTAFKPSHFMTLSRPPGIMEEYSEFNQPHLIMTYTALLALSILRDDFTRLDRAGLLQFLRACQGEDGSFATEPGQGGDPDLRSVYCAFAISSMLDDWSGVDVERGLQFIAKCRTYEGGYGQSPFCEAVGGTTYCALAAIFLAPTPPSLTAQERRQTIRWLVHNQDQTTGGLRGRTEKEPDACYCFWCGASLELLGEKELLDASSMVSFLARCQFKFGGIAKAPGEHPDPYHTYLSLAAISMYPPIKQSQSWKFDELDPLLNANPETASWARKHIPSHAKLENLTLS